MITQIASEPSRRCSQREPEPDQIVNEISDSALMKVAKLDLDAASSSASGPKLPMPAGRWLKHRNVRLFFFTPAERPGYQTL